MGDLVGIVGCGFGDEGKGSVVDALVRKHGAGLVVRFNGGAQAGHEVRLDDGRRHVFAQWGSGTFAGARTHLSRFMLVNPIFAMTEAKRLIEKGVSDPLSLLTVERGAILTTPFHVAANRLREMLRFGARHGSCGMGIGETMLDLDAGFSDVIRAGDDHDTMLSKLRSIQKRKREEFEATFRWPAFPEFDTPQGREMEILNNLMECDLAAHYYADFFAKVKVVERDWLDDQIREPGHIVFEGAQGVLLDQDHGFSPHTTWSKCTFDNVRELCGDRFGSVRRIGVLRAYHTRHGAGPFPTETATFDVLSADDHNQGNPWQGSFRNGLLDLTLVRYAAEAIDGLDGVALTRMDRLPAQVPIGVFYDVPLRYQLEPNAACLQGVEPVRVPLASKYVPDLVSKHARAPIACLSFGPMAKDKEWLR
jgi:adenylosuccinate synthase